MKKAQGNPMAATIPARNRTQTVNSVKEENPFPFTSGEPVAFGYRQLNKDTTGRMNSESEMPIG